MQRPQTNPNPDFWRDKQVLLTGHTGFKGGWLALWLLRLGAEVTGIALAPETQPNLFDLANIGKLTRHHEQDLRNAQAIARIVKQTNPDIVFHLAAQPLVRASYQDPLGTFSTNIQGTANLLDALRDLDRPRVAIAITTDKVYRNQEHAFPYRETDALGGHDPYSASKAAAELVIASYREAFLAEQGIAVASARAGNVIGGGDWSQDRLIPDAVRAWASKQTLQVRRPQATRPWQHLLEPLAGYLKLAETCWTAPHKAGAYNFGPDTHEAATVRQVIQLARTAYPDARVDYADHVDGPHEAGWLALEIAKAREQLRVQPRWNLTTGIQRTLAWYREQGEGAPADDLCHQDISAFETAANNPQDNTTSATTPRRSATP
mgnify:CR=1 FL=1